MNRRKFLKIAGLVAGSTLPMLTGMWWMANRGDGPPTYDSYAPEPWEETNQSGPVLVLINDDRGHPFGRFLAEILWTEGLNGFTAARLSEATAELLAPFACVLLSAGNCSSAQVEMLAGYAAGGGNLLAILPEDELAERLGLGKNQGSFVQGIARMNARHPLAAGIVTRPIHVHTGWRIFQEAGSEVIAWVGKTGDPAEVLYPAVLSRPYEAGWVVAWGYDLAENVVLTRQGNPANVGKLDALGVFRPIELFEGWIDFDQMAYPQADEQQRLLANILTWMCRRQVPLPRLWYFPGSARCLLVATSDSHRNTATALRRITEIVEEHQGHISIYYTPPLPSDLGVMKNQALDLGAKMGVMPEPYFPTPSFFADLRAAGHELALHPYIHGDYGDSWRAYWRGFTRMGYGRVPPTARTHDLAWQGWADAARIQAGFGIRMNTDYYHYGPLLHSKTGWIYGHFTGSGLPMRFADLDGRILDIYQQVTQLADDYIVDFPWTKYQQLGPQKGAEIATQLIQSSLAGNFAAIACNFHSDPYDMDDRWRLSAQAWLTGTLAAANENDTPIWTAQHWLAFTSARQKARFENLDWQDRKLTFDLSAEEAHEDGLSVLVPLDQDGRGLTQVQVDGQPAIFEVWRVGGVDYGLVGLGAGSHHVEAEYL